MVAVDVSDAQLLEVEGCRPWCLRCRRPGSHCLCEHITSLQPRTKFVFLMHPKEARRTKNGTARLAHLALAGSELFVGIEFGRHRRVVELLADQSLDCRLLYPAPPEHAPPRRAGALSSLEASRDGERRPVLFVIDGTWPCAKRMVGLNPALRALPRISVAVDRPSEFLTKHQPDPCCLATIEAVDRTLQALARQGRERYSAEQSERFLRPFRRMVARGLTDAEGADPGRGRHGEPAQPRGERRRGRTVSTSGRNVMFQG